jgi:type I restriction enzyme S subunit
MDLKTFLENFDAIAEADGGIPKLRSLILDLAVRGKLVAQNPEDEPAIKLLEKAQLSRLTNKTKKKSANAVQVISFHKDIPVGWIRCELGELVELVSGQHLLADQQNSYGVGIPYLTGPSDFGEISPKASRWTTVERAIAIQGDILVTVKGAGVGKTNILSLDKAAIGRQLMAIRANYIFSEFIYLLIQACRDYLFECSLGTTVPGIGRVC